MNVKWQYKRVQGVVYVMCQYGMAVWGRDLHQELWYVVYGNVINSALYGAKQVVIKVGDLYGLVDNKMVYLSSRWMSILKHLRYCLKVSRSKFWVIATDCQKAFISINLLKHLCQHSRYQHVNIALMRSI